MKSNRRKFIRQIGLGSVALGLPIFNIGCKSDAKIIEDFSTKLNRASPESQGTSSQTIIDFLDSIEESGEDFHSLMVLKNGNVIAEAWWDPYSPNYKQQLYSLSKSFTSTAIGFASDEGLLSVEDPIIKFFPDDLPTKISNNLKALKVKHLLSMSVGHAEDSIKIIEVTKGEPWARAFLRLPVVFEPGSQFMYNSGASFMLCAIIDKVTGMSAHEYLIPRLFEPLGIEDSTWTENPDGINMGASHLRVKTEDIAKFSQLMLQNGVWNGDQILSKEWVQQATTKRIDNGEDNHSWGYGYGYQFWMNPPGGFRSDGAFGQYGMVIPEKDLVVAITSESKDKAKVMQMVWDLVPLIGTMELPKNEVLQSKLEKELADKRYTPPSFKQTSATIEKVNGVKYDLDQNEWGVDGLTLKFEQDKVHLILHKSGDEDHIIEHGIETWFVGKNHKRDEKDLFSALRIDFDSAVAATSTWKDENILLLTWRYIETTHTDQLSIEFIDDQLSIDFLNSIFIMENESVDQRSTLNGQVSS